MTLLVKKKIVIGSIVHNRFEILPMYLDSLVKNIYDEIDVSFCFILNNCDEATLDIFNSFKRDNEFEVNLIYYDEVYSFEKRRQYNYNAMAQLRNILLSNIGDADFLFSVDTDIFAPKGTLKKLVNDDKDICAALVYNDSMAISHRQPEQQKYPFRRMNILNFQDKDDYMYPRHILDYPQNSLFQVDITGAIYLMKNEVAKNCRYAKHTSGEDVPFCIDALKKGYEIWADSSIICEHRMELAN